MDNPSIPPPARRFFPKDEFGAWLAKQAMNGHDRQWLERNKTDLRKRWERTKEDLPMPERPVPVVPDRYDEL